VRQRRRPASGDLGIKLLGLVLGLGRGLGDLGVQFLGVGNVLGHRLRF
jgi:hypothetical protein